MSWRAGHRMGVCGFSGWRLAVIIRIIIVIIIIIGVLYCVGDTRRD
jgi:uncharacterized membrane protein